MVEPLACVLRGLHETGVEIGDTVAVIGGGPIGLMFVHVAQAGAKDVAELGYYSGHGRSRLRGGLRLNFGTR